MTSQLLNHRFYRSVGWLVAVVLCLLSNNVLRADDARDSRSMVRLVSKISAKLEGSVAQVLCGNRIVSLATVVSDKGHLVTKRSELTNDPIRIRLWDSRLYPARIAATRRRNDLALLVVDAPIEWKPVQFVDTLPPLGSFVISVGRLGDTISFGGMGANPRRVAHNSLLGVSFSEPEGRPTINQVISGSGADSAGLQIGDVIVGINERAEPSSHMVRQALKKMFPGEEVRLRVYRPLDDTTSEVLDLVAKVKDRSQLGESDNDRRVNGRRSMRLTGFEKVIQHDTVLEPEQCGGPLIDSKGQVIGINIARAGRVVSYSLPSSLLMRDVSQMLNEANYNSATVPAN
ncbi:MAG: PDZ domain-containing protein [Planctomycetota bacterium]